MEEKEGKKKSAIQLQQLHGNQNCATSSVEIYHNSIVYSSDLLAIGSFHNFALNVMKACVFLTEAFSRTLNIGRCYMKNINSI